MKWLAVLALLSACETTPYVTTPLDGSIPCGMDACAGGAVCIENYRPGGTDNPTRCFSPPDGCYIFTCDRENCAPCMRDQCEPFPIGIVGRNVYCEEGQ